MRVEWFIPLLLALELAISRRSFVSAEIPDDDGQEVVILSFPRDVTEEERVRIVRASKKLINETSHFLHISTGTVIPEVVFLLPESWNTETEDWREFGDISHPSSSEKLSNAQIIVKRDGPYRDGPIATQYRACGAPGRRMILPIEFLNETEIAYKAKLLAREWIKHRYGVFDENGYDDDPRFPAYFKIPGSPEDEIQINDCSNVPVNYTFQDAEGYNCVLEVDRSSGLPIDNSTCFVRVIPEENQEVRSSLMDKNLEGLSNVDNVCGSSDQYPHNSNAPSKQNAFCRGRSILDVMKKHKDFANKTNYFYEEDHLEPTFRLVKQQNLRMIVAVDDTSGMKHLKASLKNSLDILTHLLPNTSEFGVLKFKNTTVTELVPLTRLDRLDKTNRGVDIANNIKFLFRDNIMSKPELAIEDAATRLIPNDTPRSGTIIVIAATNPSDLDPASTKKFTYLCLIAVAIRESNAKAFEEFIKIHKFDPTCSKVFRIFEEGFHALRQINEVFDFAVDRSDYHDENILIRGEELTSDLPLSMIIDSSVSSFDILITSNTVLNLDDDDFEFKESGTDKKLKAMSLYQDVMLFRVNETKAGMWECKLSIEGQSLLATVMTRTMNGSYSFKLNAWTEAESVKDEYQSPIMLYAEVFYGNYPVIDASVAARIMSPDGNEIVFELLDNGLGDPDITQSDGIYTRYFTQFTVTGDYKVIVLADDNGGRATIEHESDFHSCCGSEMKYADKKPVSMFRITDEATFTTESEKPQDGFEPCQVLDLRIMETSTHLVFSLQWTAPGNEKDRGTAKEYHLKVFKTGDDAYKSFDSEGAYVQAFGPEDLISPSSYGTLENVSIHINDSIPKDVAYYLSLQTISENGKTSKVSNVVQIFISSYSPIVTDDPESTTTSNVDSAGQSSMPRSTAIGIAIGAFLLVAALVVIGYVSFHCYSKKKAKRKDIESNSTPAPINPPKPANDIDGSVSANEWQLDQDHISPVNSVPAKVLLYHHEQVKDAKMKNVDPPLFTLENLRNTDTENAEDTPEDVAEPNEYQNETSEVIQNANQPSNAKPRRTTNV